MNRTLLSISLLALFAGCTPERTPAVDTPTGSVADQPAQDVPPAPAPTPTPHGGPLDGDRNLASFDGYGDIRFGAPVADMETAWGGKLNTVGKDTNDSCYFMTPTWVKTPAEFNFMIGDGKFARFGTESARFTAPGDGKIGMTSSEIEKLYPGRIEERPHKYTNGKYLRIEDTASDRALVFETDAAGKVTEWRVGVPPQVDYVEGCS